MIELNDIQFSYEKKKVLKNISATFQAGKIHGIVGLNGAGKTTFFNLLSTVLVPDEGAINIDGNKIHRTDTAFLETANYFYPRLTGNDYLGIFNQTNKKFKLDSFQKYFNLPLDQLIDTYSAGMKKKLALLAILKQEKKVYLFDEPFNGLDLESGKILEIILESLRKENRTIFISSHILAPLLNVCDDITILENGSFKSRFEKEQFSEIESSLFSQFLEKARENIEHNF